MKKEIKFYGIFDKSDFKELQEEDQKKLLIDTQIYVLGKSIELFDEDEFDAVFDGNPSDYFIYLGSDFEINNKKYTLNIEFLNEVFSNIMNDFELNTPKYINKNLKRLNINLETYTNGKERSQYINNVRITGESDYRSNLNSKLFMDLHEDKNEIRTNQILKKHLKHNHYQLSNYLFGIEKFEFYSIYSKLYSFKSIKSVLEFCSENEIEQTEFNLKPIDTSIQVFLIEGLLNIEGWVEISSRKKAKIIKEIIGKNEDNIRKVYEEMNKKQSENSQKFLTDRNKAIDIINQILG